MTNQTRAPIKTWALCLVCKRHNECIKNKKCTGCEMYSRHFIDVKPHKTLCKCNSIADGDPCPYFVDKNEKENEQMEHFEKELSFIKNEQIREKTKKVVDAINETFYEVGASSTGKYHPSYALGYEGLYRHTCAAVRIAEDLMSLEHNAKIFEGDSHDYVIAALILHDSCKCGRNWTSRYTLHEHPTEAASFIQFVIDGNYESDEVSEYVGIVGSLVSSHMGQWNTNYRSRKILPKPTSITAQMVHIADYLASRKYLEFVFDNEVVELKENSREIIKEA